MVNVHFSVASMLKRTLRNIDEVACLSNNDQSEITVIGTLLSHVMRTYAKTKAQISCAVTAQLISAFVFYLSSDTESINF